MVKNHMSWLICGCIESFVMIALWPFPLSIISFTRQCEWIQTSCRSYSSYRQINIVISVVVVVGKDVAVILTFDIPRILRKMSTTDLIPTTSIDWSTSVISKVFSYNHPRLKSIFTVHWLCDGNDAAKHNQLMMPKHKNILTWNIIVCVCDCK